MLCKSWRALQTAECGDTLTQDLLTFYPRSTELSPPFTMQYDTVPLFFFFDTVPLKSPPPAQWGPRTPSPPFSPGLCSCDLLLSLCHPPFAHPLLFKYLLLWLLSISFAFPDFLRLGDSRPGICNPLHIPSPWRYCWGLRLWMSSHTNDSQAYILALTAHQKPDTAEILPDISLWISAPNQK